MHTYTNIHTYTYIYIHAYTYMHVHTYTYMHIHTCIYIHTYVRTYVRTYVHTDRQTDRQTNRETDIHTYTHTHTHTYIYILHMFFHNICIYWNYTFVCCQKMENNTVQQLNPMGPGELWNGLDSADMWCYPVDTLEIPGFQDGENTQLCGGFVNGRTMV